MIISLLWLPFLLIFLYFILFRNDKKKTIYSGIITKKYIESGNDNSSPEYLVSIDNEKEFDLMAFYPSFWNQIFVGQMIEIHEANGSIFNIETWEKSMNYD